MGQVAEAAPGQYERVLGQTTEEPTALRGLAAIWQSRNRPTEAAELLSRLVAVTPADRRRG